MKKGFKLDQGKLRWSLVPLESATEIVKVLEHGARKYSPQNWKKVPKLRERYYNALLRHVFAWESGEKTDSESGLLHLAHAGCCILFLIFFDLKQQRRKR